MLEVLLDSAPDSVNKSLGLAQALAKKCLEFLPANRDVSLVFYLTLVLLPLEQNGIFQENNRKRNSVWACGNGVGKVIFALLEEIVTLQMNFTLINVREPNFQSPLTWTFIVRSGGDDGSGGNNGSWNRCRSSRIHNGLEDPLEVIFQVSNHREIGGARSSKQSDNRYNNGSRSTCCDQSRDATVATLGRDSASKFVFAVIKILVRIATSGGTSHQTGWVGASKKSF